MAEQLPQTDRFSTGFALPALSLAHREVIRFLRQRSRVIGALATPILRWIFLAARVGRAERFRRLFQYQTPTGWLGAAAAATPAS